MKPCLYVVGNVLPQAWEKSITALRDLGAAYPGRYYAHPMVPGRHAQMTMRIEQFDAEPRIHKGFTLTPDDLFAYVDEVLHGTDRQWDYTYHDRIFRWGFSGVNTITVDQMQYVVNCLNRKVTSHKACIVLGHPKHDVGDRCDGDGTHIPCLRHIGYELDQVADGYRLNTYLHWRTRDALHAAFANLFALSHLTAYLAAQLADRMHVDVAVGGCVDMSDDYHVNGKDWPMTERITSRCGMGDYWTVADLRELMGENDGR